MPFAHRFLFTSLFLPSFAVFFSFLLFPCRRVWEHIVNEFHISCSHTEWYFFFARLNNPCFGRSFVYNYKKYLKLTVEQQPESRAAVATGFITLNSYALLVACPLNVTVVCRPWPIPRCGGHVRHCWGAHGAPSCLARIKGIRCPLTRYLRL